MAHRRLTTIVDRLLHQRSAAIVAWLRLARIDLSGDALIEWRFTTSSLNLRSKLLRCLCAMEVASRRRLRLMGLSAHQLARWRSLS